MNLKKKLRKIYWVFHEAMSMMSHVAWIDHRITELDEAIAEANKVLGENKPKMSFRQGENQQ